MSSNQKLYYPIDSVKNTFSKVAMTSFYKVAFPISGGLTGWLKNTGLYITQNSDGLDPIESIELLCSAAILPGTNLKMTEVMGNRQGVLEKYPIFKQYPELSLTFYVDSNHQVIKFFEEWTNYITPLYSTKGGEIPVTNKGLLASEAKNENDYFRMRYPNNYTQTIYITKFERDLNTVKLTGTKNNAYKLQNSSTLTYEFVKAYPSNIVASAVAYEGTSVLSYTVTFVYSRYFVNTSQPEFGTTITLPDLKTFNFSLPNLGETTSSKTPPLNIGGVDQVIGNTAGFDANIA